MTTLDCQALIGLLRERERESFYISNITLNETIQFHR